MQTVSETEIFQKYAESVWSESERIEFINWIAANPLAGDVVPGLFISMNLMAASGY